MTSSDVRAGLLLAEGLGAAARVAVEHDVGEQAYLRLARGMYRRIAGAPRPGPKPAPHGAWDPLLAAVGGQTALARALCVSRKTVQRWVTGASTPSPEHGRALLELADEHGVRVGY